MYVKKAYFGRNATELTVPAGAYVYVFSEEDKDGFVTVIFDGQVRYFLWFYFLLHSSELWVIYLWLTDAFYASLCVWLSRVSERAAAKLPSRNSEEKDKR